MHTFTNTEHLKQYLSSDIGANSICPIRFINIETMRDWVIVKSFLEQLCPETIFMSTYCETIDSTPNLRRLNAILRNLDNPTLLAPLSEHLRINNQAAQRILSGLLSMQFINGGGNNLKLYIPLYRMKSLLAALHTTPRHDDCIIYLQNSADVDYSLTIVQDTLNANIEGNVINGYKNYLVYWEQNPDKPIVLHTQNAIHFQDIVVSDNVQVIVTAYELLRTYYRIPESIKFEWGNAAEWKYLLSKYSRGESIDNILAKAIGVRDFDSSLFENWEAKNDNTKWLIWLWAKMRAETEYLKIVMQKSIDFVDLQDVVYNSIFDCLNDTQYFSLYKERKSLIMSMGITPQDTFWTKYVEQPVFNQIKILTDLTEKEQAAFLLALSQMPMNDSILEIIRNNHPLLSAYLEVSEFDNPLIADYFERYKWQKMLDKIEPEFLSLVDSLADGQCEELWKLPSRNSLIDKVYDDESIVLYVDAFGVEYCSLLKKLLEERSLYVSPMLFGHCNIPSTTAENKDFIMGKKAAPIIYSLDELKHSNNPYPYSLIKEFETIKKIIEKIEELFSGDIRRVILSSDHGASRLVILADGENFKIDETVKKYKYGRYCVDSENDYSNCKGCVNKDDYWIFANYNRFATQGAPLNETHGGATLEECIVPVICIQKTAPTETQSEKVTVTWYSKSIPELSGNKAQLEFRLSKQLDNVVVVINGKRYSCAVSEGIYAVTHATTKETTYTARIVAKEIVGNITYSVVKGSAANPNFDL